MAIEPIKESEKTTCVVSGEYPINQAVIDDRSTYGAGGHVAGRFGSDPLHLIVGKDFGLS